MLTEEIIIHPIAPLYDEDSEILILGSFPSVKSREQQFFYGHPQNRFWSVISSVFGDDPPKTIEEKKQFLHFHHIALWDVISSCRIKGSADSTIADVIPNDISVILENSAVKKIFVNGKTAEKYFLKYIQQKVEIKAVCLPSTSPANAAWNLSKLCFAWNIVKE